MKKKNWSVPTKDADKIMKGIEQRLIDMFGKIKHGTELNSKGDKMKVIYPFAGGVFSTDCRLMDTYIGIEKKNNSEMYIRFVQGSENILAAGAGMGFMIDKFKGYHDEISRFITFYTDPKNNGYDWV